MSVFSALRRRLTYANVMATLALFIALGGTGWAVTRLPRNSVGPSQIRTNAVGASEIRSKAVRSTEIRDRTVQIGDLATSARDALRGRPGPAGQPGPPGPVGPAGISYHAAINSAGLPARGNARDTGVGSVPDSTVVSFERDVSSCEAAATLAAVPGGTIVDPPLGFANVRPNGRGVEVRTYRADGTPQRLPFNLIVAC